MKAYETAFPVNNANVGITTRDYIAIMAMQSLISEARSFDAIAFIAYRIADAMIEESNNDYGTQGSNSDVGRHR